MPVRSSLTVGEKWKLEFRESGSPSALKSAGGSSRYLVIWLALLMVGIWLCAQIQSGVAGLCYVGAQAGVAFLLRIAHGQGPPKSLVPSLDRLAGMTVGLALLMLVTIVFSLFRRDLSAVPHTGRG
ncbi:MAG TPA: hypothetical protein VMB81_26090 [Candidatus Sulfotelmatobacter sp.]|nr:hypothetical protein [Candidatus Sulfotelmatobacter sp.]